MTSTVGLRAVLAPDCDIAALVGCSVTVTVNGEAIDGEIVRVDLYAADEGLPPGSAWLTVETFGDSGHQRRPDPAGGGGRHAGMICDGECCDPCDEASLAEFHRHVARQIGDDRAREQAAKLPPVRSHHGRFYVGDRSFSAPDPTAILDEPEWLPDWQRSAAAVLDAGAEWCEDCGYAHPPLAALLDRLTSIAPEYEALGFIVTVPGT